MLATGAAVEVSANAADSDDDTVRQTPTPPTQWGKLHRRLPRLPPIGYVATLPRQLLPPTDGRGKLDRRPLLSPRHGPSPWQLKHLPTPPPMQLEKRTYRSQQPPQVRLNLLPSQRGHRPSFPPT